MQVDLLFAVLSHSEIDPDPAVFNVLDDENFQGVDEQTALGLNGPPCPCVSSGASKIFAQELVGQSDLSCQYWGFVHTWR